MSDDAVKELIVLEMPNFRLRERETSAGQISFDLQRKRVGAQTPERWEHVPPGDMIASWAFVRELGFVLRGGVKR